MRGSELEKLFHKKCEEAALLCCVLCSPRSRRQQHDALARRWVLARTLYCLVFWKWPRLKRQRAGCSIIWSQLKRQRASFIPPSEPAPAPTVGLLI